MPVVLLEKNDPSKFSSLFSVGEHIIGRGANLFCNSKRVSRNHGILKLTENSEVFLRSTHNNPCFYQRSNNPNIALVTFGNSVEIRNDDLIALSLDHGWFKVHIRDATNENTGNAKRAGSPIESAAAETAADPVSNKRAHNESNEPAGKRTKVCAVSTQAANEGHDSVIPQVAAIQEEPVPDKLEEVASGSGLPANSGTGAIKTESDVQETDANATTSAKKSVKEEEESPKNGAHTSPAPADKDTDKAKANPSTSGTSKRAWRDKCWYAATCYRKNAAHRAELRHPGDSDFESDPDDMRPTCCYGVDCYRKSREHRRRLKHPGQKKLGTKPKLTRKRRTVKVNAPSPHPSDSDEPYYDSGSDEYMPSEASDTESDYEDDEDYSQNDDRLLLQREARKFTRKK